MATTKIWTVKDNLERTVNYAANPEKTIDPDLKKAIHYAGDEAKTESRCYVTGVNCNADTAFEEMSAVQERFGKTGGNVAYHAYQSFKTGEITPELCHEIGVKLAKKMWGNEYQVLVATHLNTAPCIITLSFAALICGQAKSLIATREPTGNSVLCRTSFVPNII